MKVTVERDGFSEAISAAMRTAGRANTIPILNNVLLRPNGLSLGIEGTNLDIHLETAVPAEITDTQSDGAIAVVGDALVGIVNRMPKGKQITLQWTDDKGGVSVQCGASRYKLKALPGGDFPSLTRPTDPVTFSLPGKPFAATLDAVQFAMGRDKARINLHGVYTHCSADDHAGLSGSKEAKLCFVATSGYELARASMTLPAGASKMPSVILPDVAIPEIIRLVGAGDDEVAVAATRNRFTFSKSGTTFTTKLIDATFPDYMRVIPAGQSPGMIVDSTQLSEALLRLREVADGEQMRADLTNRELKLSLWNDKVGDAEEKVEVEWEGEPLTIGMRLRGVQMSVDAANGDQCVFRFDGHTVPILINAWRSGAIDHTRTFVTVPLAVR